MRAKFLNEGEPWGRRELDVVLGDFDVGDLPFLYCWVFDAVVSPCLELACMHAWGFSCSFIHTYTETPNPSTNHDKDDVTDKFFFSLKPGSNGPPRRLPSPRPPNRLPVRQIHPHPPPRRLLAPIHEGHSLPRDALALLAPPPPPRPGLRGPLVALQTGDAARLGPRRFRGREHEEGV